MTAPQWNPRYDTTDRGALQSGVSEAEALVEAADALFARRLTS